MSSAAGRAITLGDPVPGFEARTITGASVSLHADAGRWVVLAFLGSLEEPRAAQELAALLGEARHFAEHRLVVYGVLAAPSAPKSVDQAGRSPLPSSLHRAADFTDCWEKTAAHLPVIHPPGPSFLLRAELPAPAKRAQL